MKAIRGVVRGRVQGVGFRFFTRSAAERLKVSGWVKNLMNSDVEFFAQGDAQTVDALVAELKKGPAGSRVEKVTIEESAPDAKRSGFEIQHDY